MRTSYMKIVNLKMPLACAVLVMSWSVSVVFCIAVATAGCQRFPESFQFGVATAAYQIEGSWNASDKTPSMWDDWTQQFPHKVADGTTGDVACDSYLRWREDIRLLKDLGVDFYRFSISWPRLLPTGFPNKISEDGVRYYNELIDELLKHGIQPYVTIYHWDMPLRLHNMGGWNNPLIVDWYTSYARVVFSLFGDRVRTWLTINEPLLICDLPNHGWGPGTEDPLIGLHLCARHVLLAHGRTWKLYQEEFKEKQQGRLSLANQMIWYEPNEPGDEELSELVLQYMNGRYTHPIYSKEGGWPPSIEKFMAEKSKEEGYPVSRLPPFSQEEIELIRGSFDFCAVNHYTSQTVRAGRAGDTLATTPLFDVAELRAATAGRAQWPRADNQWLYVYPEGLRNMLLWLKREYGDLEIFITENGYSSSERSLEDEDRLQYYRGYMKQVLLAIEQDGVNVTGYTMWSLMDNFEWVDGYKSKFGIHDVDFSDPQRRRRPRKSALFYRDVIRTRSLDVPDPQIKDEL